MGLVQSEVEFAVMADDKIHVEQKKSFVGWIYKACENVRCLNPVTIVFITRHFADIWICLVQLNKWCQWWTWFVLLDVFS